jgi:hypothetical protein
MNEGASGGRSTTAALNWSKKFRRFVILVSIRSCWIHLSTLSEFAGALHRSTTLVQCAAGHRLINVDSDHTTTCSRKTVDLMELVK